MPDSLPYATPIGPLTRMVRYAWAAPCSLVGLLFAALAVLGGGSAERVRGVLEVALHGDTQVAPWWTRLPFGAITFGHVVIGTHRTQLAALREHERVHVRQYERWGIAFFVAYPLSSLVQLLRGRSPYWHNWFEIEAYAASRPPA